jgi:hypothetical protein
LVRISPEIPFIPEKAFYPIHPNGEGVYYSWRECVRRFVVCTKWERKEVLFKFSDREAMGWFLNNDFGFKKRQGP